MTDWSSITMDEKKVSPDPSNGADLVAGAILGTFWLCILLRATKQKDVEPA